MSDLGDRVPDPLNPDDGSVLLAPEVLRRLCTAISRTIRAEMSRDGGRPDRTLLDALQVLAESARLQEVLGTPPPRLAVVVESPPALVALTTADAAAARGCSDRHVRELARAGRIDRLGFVSCEKVGKAWIIKARAA